MYLKEYQRFAHHGIRHESEGKNLLVGFALGLAGEAGEIIDDIKKRVYHGRDIPIEHTKEELGDVMWYIANLCNEMGFDLNDILLENMNKLLKRYPDLYTGWKYIKED